VPDVSVTPEQLQQAIAELSQGSGFSIAGVAITEQQLQARFNVQQFSQLGLGADSLLQLLQHSRSCWRCCRVAVGQGQQ
jgi:hypothetical protein